MSGEINKYKGERQTPEVPKQEPLWAKLIDPANFRFLIMVSILILLYGCDPRIQNLMNNVTELSLGDVTIKLSHFDATTADSVLLRGFTVLHTHVNPRKLKVINLNFKGNDGEEWIIVQALKDNIDLRYGFVADAKSMYGQSTSKKIKDEDIKEHQHKARTLLTFDPKDQDFKDLKLNKGEKLKIYTNVSEKNRDRVRKKNNEIAVGTLDLDDFKEKKLIWTDIDNISEANWKREDGIWKSDYYEVDRVVIADTSGEILLDFTYTLLPYELSFLERIETIVEKFMAVVKDSSIHRASGV